MRELSAAISARTSWRSSARSGRMALNRCGPPGRVVENRRSPPLVLRGGLRERQHHNLFKCRRRLRGRVSEDTPADSPGTGGCRDPRNAILGAFLRVVWRRSTRNSPRRRFGGSRVHRRARNCSLPRKAQGNEGDLRVEFSFCSLGRPAAVPFPAATISMSTRARCLEPARVD